MMSAVYASRMKDRNYHFDKKTFRGEKFCDDSPGMQMPAAQVPRGPLHAPKLCGMQSPSLGPATMKASVVQLRV